MALLFSGFQDGPHLIQGRLTSSQAGEFVITRTSTGDFSLHAHDTLETSSRQDRLANIAIRTHIGYNCTQLSFEAITSDIHIVVHALIGQSNPISLKISAEENGRRNVLILTPGVIIGFPDSEATISLSAVELDGQSKIISSTPIERQILKQLDENPNPDYKVDVTASLDPRGDSGAISRLGLEHTTQASASNTKILETPHAQRIRSVTNMAESQEGHALFSTAHDEPTTNEEVQENQLPSDQVDGADDATDSEADDAHSDIRVIGNHGIGLAGASRNPVNRSISKAYKSPLVKIKQTNEQTLASASGRPIRSAIFREESQSPISERKSKKQTVYKGSNASTQPRAVIVEQLKRNEIVSSPYAISKRGDQPNEAEDDDLDGTGEHATDEAEDVEMDGSEVVEDLETHASPSISASFTAINRSPGNEDSKPSKKRGRPKKGPANQRPPKKKARATVAETVENKSVMSPIATAATASSEDAAQPLLHGKVSVAFSSSKVPDQAKLKQYIDRNVSVIKNVTEKVAYLCVGRGELKRTSKVLLAVAYGIPIINDQWFIQSAKIDKLLDPLKFLASDEAAENSSGVDSDWSSGKGCPALFDKMNFYITPALKATYASGYRDISKLITVLGGKLLPSGSARAVKTETKKLLVLGLAENDVDAVMLDEKKIPCFDREWLPLTILRRHVDVEDSEHRLTLTDDAKPKKGRGKKV